MRKVSVVVVCYNSEENIKECISSLLNQTHPKDHYEIIFIDNGSTDKTQEIIIDYASRFPNLRMVINPIVGIATSRNVGIREAKYNYIASTDSDCFVPPDWLENLVKGYTLYHEKDENIIAVGGANLPPQNTGRFFDALTIFLNTFLGSRGSVQGMRFRHDREVHHIPTVNVMHTKDKLLEVNGFDETFGNIGEDQDLSFRLSKLGYRFYYLSNSYVWHKLRPILKSWLKNMFIYGKGRMWLLRKHPQMVHPVFIIPIGLVLALPLTLLSLWKLFFILPLIYFPLVLCASIWACWRQKRPDMVLRVFALYLGTHIAYGIGEIYGLIKNRNFSRPSGLN